MMLTKQATSPSCSKGLWTDMFGLSPVMRCMTCVHIATRNTLHAARKADPSSEDVPHKYRTRKLKRLERLPTILHLTPKLSGMKSWTSLRRQQGKQMALQDAEFL